MEEDGRIIVYITYKAKTVAFRVYPKKSLKETIANIVQVANSDVQRCWWLPEFNNGGVPSKYYLGKYNENGVLTIYKHMNNERKSFCLEDYDVKEGDYLVLIKKLP